MYLNGNHNISAQVHHGHHTRGSWNHDSYYIIYIICDLASGMLGLPHEG